MVRIPLFNERSARIEVRSVGPDANPYLALYALVKIGLEGPLKQNDKNKRPRVKYLPGNINTAIQLFRQSKIIPKLLGDELKRKFVELKQIAADRSPMELGTKVKNGEVLYHHEVYNQMLWNDF